MTDLELRRQVAEARGWTDIVDSSCYVTGDLFLSGLHAEHSERLKWPIPAYETDIAAAWELVKELREVDCDVAVVSCGSAWCLQFMGGYTEMQPTETIAICKAYLQYKNGDTQ